MASGNVVIIQDERMHEPDTLHVDVVAYHDASSYLHAISVCALERKPGEQGIGIFVCFISSPLREGAKRPFHRLQRNGGQDGVVKSPNSHLRSRSGSLRCPTVIPST